MGCETTNCSSFSRIELRTAYCRSLTQPGKDKRPGKARARPGKVGREAGGQGQAREDSTNHGPDSTNHGPLDTSLGDDWWLKSLAKAHVSRDSLSFKFKV